MLACQASIHQERDDTAKVLRAKDQLTMKLDQKILKLQKESCTCQFCSGQDEKEVFRHNSDFYSGQDEDNDHRCLAGNKKAAQPATLPQLFQLLFLKFI